MRCPHTAADKAAAVHGQRDKAEDAHEHGLGPLLLTLIVIPVIYGLVKRPKLLREPALTVS